MHKLNSIGPLLEGFKPCETLPQQKRTVIPMRQRVVGSVGKSPVNKQAALIIRPNRDWLAQPVPDKLDRESQKNVKELKNQLKAEYNAHAETKAKLGMARAEVRCLKAKAERAAARERELEAAICLLSSQVCIDERRKQDVDELMRGL
jgi:hypothetical protein